MRLTAPSDTLLATREADRATPATPPRGTAVIERFGLRHGDTEVGVLAIRTGTEFDRPVAVLDDLWIRPEHRRSGLGAAAVAEAERWASGHGAPRLSVACVPDDPAHLALFRDYQVVSRHMVIPVGDAVEPTAIRADPMTEAEYGPWLAHSVTGFAEVTAESQGFTPEEATDRAKQVFAQLLPDGLATEGHELWMVRQGDDVVAHLWLFHDAPDGHTFIFDIEVTPDRRGTGLGKETMALARWRAAVHGRDGVKLNVFATNEVATGLYRRLGYRATVEFRFKALTG
ncbi:acetyltransferase (GNAT) family protein [Stackebrandtia albiflava]|uniref:Acetyltransferase (GNAT) family protein n=1 Tax=Stackebrandtia albiflava TaxID=406432 RepID=A0A562VGX3_9ACTN|nr:GNAT family N-acetyltransferase [Stackebrandtia albiflava]TWJ17139.1 acetyltransferase (GNAT) family protein [Stackebrandtia albiflava]